MKNIKLLFAELLISVSQFIIFTGIIILFPIMEFDGHSYIKSKLTLFFLMPITIGVILNISFSIIIFFLLMLAKKEKAKFQFFIVQFFIFNISLITSFFLLISPFKENNFSLKASVFFLSINLIFSFFYYKFYKKHNYNN